MTPEQRQRIDRIKFWVAIVLAAWGATIILCRDWKFAVGAFCIWWSVNILNTISKK